MIGSRTRQHKDHLARVQFFGFKHVIFARICEYDDQEVEFWVNTRTSGTLSREDLQRLSISQTHEGQAGADGFLRPPEGEDHFPDLCGENPPDLQIEGDSNVQATGKHSESPTICLTAKCEINRSIYAVHSLPSIYINI